MYRIGEFSKLSKTTIKALRYYEKEKLLIPFYIDKSTGYRYYEANQLLDLARIVSLRQIGLSINSIKQILEGNSMQQLLMKRKQELESQFIITKDQLQRINYLMEEKNMEYEVIKKELPECIVYYKEGIIKSYGDITDFILSSAEECYKTNPDIKCVEPDYCFINYLDGEYKEANIKIRYSQAVVKAGVPNETIHFKKLEPVEAVCIYHKGEYSQLPKAYGFIMKWIEENNYEMVDFPRERYIDGIWNKESWEDWLTEIQVPVKQK